MIMRRALQITWQGCLGWPSSETAQTQGGYV